jgi:hypothetical protein
MFTSEGPHIVMSRTDAQNGLDFHFKLMIAIAVVEVQSDLSIILGTRLPLT